MQGTRAGPLELRLVSEAKTPGEACLNSLRTQALDSERSSNTSCMASNGLLKLCLAQSP